MGRVVVGTDGSPDARVALRWAVEFARATGAELVIARAWHPSFVEVPPEVHDELRHEASERLAGEGDVVDGSVPVRTELIDGDPREGLLALGEREGADLLVVGARGRGGHPHALHLGSVTHYLVHHTTRPLAAVPASARPVFPTRVVLGVDGSDGSARAVAWCGERGSAVASEVVAVLGEPVMAEWVPRQDPESWYRLALGRCEEWVAPVRDAGVPSRAQVVDQEPVVALADVAAREGAGLIVVGARGRGRISGLRLGSTALGVLHRGGLPVVLVP